MFAKKPIVKFLTEDLARAIDPTLPLIDNDGKDNNGYKFYVIPYYTNIFSGAVSVFLSSVLPDSVICMTSENGIDGTMRVDYYLKNGPNFLRTVEVILKNNKLYILKPLVDMEYMVESNEKYQQFITNINK